MFPSVNYAALLLIFDLAKYAEKLVNRTLTQNPLKKTFGRDLVPHLWLT